MSKEKCDNCGTELVIDCPVCGAPNCCPKCCREATAELKEHLAETNTKCPKCGAELTPDELRRSEAYGQFRYPCGSVRYTKPTVRGGMYQDASPGDFDESRDCLRRQLSNMAIKKTRLSDIVKCLLVRCNLTADEIKRFYKEIEE